MPIKRCGKKQNSERVYMNQFIKMDEEYRKWIEDIGKRYKQRQIKASVSVNQEMIGFYWSIGRDIVEKSAESKWGSGFFVNLSKDMRTILPGIQGLSSSNLRYMKKFYELYSDSILPQFVEELKSKEDSINVPQLVGDLSDKELFSIPWDIIELSLINVNWTGKNQYFL